MGEEDEAVLASFPKVLKRLLLNFICSTTSHYRLYFSCETCCGFAYPIGLGATTVLLSHLYGSAQVG